MEAKDLIAIVIAALSLVVSVYALYMQHGQQHERLKVKGSFGYLATAGSLSEEMVLLEVSNTGHRTVTISSYALRMPNNKVIVFPYRQQHVTLPYELAAGKSCTMCVPIIEVARTLASENVPEKTKLTPQFSTQGGKVFHGKSIKVQNLIVWAKAA